MMLDVRSLVKMTLAVALAACGGGGTSGFDSKGETPAIEDTPGTPQPSLGGADASATDCSHNAQGCPCSAKEPVACFTGPAELRGREGCKDGTQTCEPHGELSTWSACAGEVLTCAPPPSTTPGGGPDASTPGTPGTPVPTLPGGLSPGPGGVIIAAPNYTQCVALPSAGKRGYGECAADQVVVIVNDGKSQEMTCCPVGQNVLSSVAAEHNVVRAGVCLADEVATGMKEPQTPSVFCTKINSTYLKLSAPTLAKYVTGKLPGVIGQIASSYNVNDTCLCEEGSVVIGGHTTQDNKCTDKCVRIEKK